MHELECLFGLITAPVANHFAIGFMVGITAGLVLSLVADKLSSYISGSK